jgi:hypothetical protein
MLLVVPVMQKEHRRVEVAASTNDAAAQLLVEGGNAAQSTDAFTARGKVLALCGRFPIYSGL